ncbi:MAG: hypothetical protein WAO15_12025, partial [Mycobacterium sp.]
MAPTLRNGAINTTVFYWLTGYYRFQQTLSGSPVATITIRSPVEFDPVTRQNRGGADMTLEDRYTRPLAGSAALVLIDVQ